MRQALPVGAASLFGGFLIIRAFQSIGDAMVTLLSKLPLPIALFIGVWFLLLAGLLFYGLFHWFTADTNTKNNTPPQPPLPPITDEERAARRSFYENKQNWMR
jgi:hypothetical protein